MGHYKIRIYTHAKRDLEEIVEYLNTLSAEIAIRQYDQIEAARSLGVAKQTFYNILEDNGLAKKEDVRVNNRVAEIQTGINRNGIVLCKSTSRDGACDVIKKAIEYTEPKLGLEASTDNFIKYAYIYILIELGRQGKWKKMQRTVLCEELEVSIDSYYTYTRESKECELFKIFCRGVIKNIRFC